MPKRAQNLKNEKNQFVLNTNWTQKYKCKAASSKLKNQNKFEQMTRGIPE